MTESPRPTPGEALRANRPHIICLCGSTRFIEQFAIQTWELELKGYIVLGCTLLPMWYCGVRDHFAETLGVKGQRDEHHLRKIDLADEVLVLNIGGYIGESTRNEIAYAERTGKPVSYIEPPAALPPEERYPEEMCLISNPLPKPPYLQCTLLAGHSGWHVAHDDARAVVGTWPDESEV